MKEEKYLVTDRITGGVKSKINEIKSNLSYNKKTLTKKEVIAILGTNLERADRVAYQEILKEFN